jgi:Rrf2 family iron-sulfur cluster assembly transcriptional regulator
LAPARGDKRTEAPKNKPHHSRQYFLTIGPRPAIGEKLDTRERFMLSKTAQYALRAMVYIAHKGQGRAVLAREIAKHTGVPAQYLSRILREAVRRDLLESARGIGGGFRLTRPAGKIHLSEILEPFDVDLGPTQCPFGQVRCQDDHPCGFHALWKPVANDYWQMLKRTTLAEVGPQGLKVERKGAKSQAFDLAALPRSLPLDSTRQAATMGVKSKPTRRARRRRM